MIVEKTRNFNANCSTIIIGRDISTTGRVIVAHNEDDPHGLTATYLVPRKKHAPGETITFDDGSAVVPEVPETFAYYWSEVRAPGGEAFADLFYNEHGVLVCSNRAVPCRKNDDESLGGGLGYGIRRLTAERARSAREAVKIIGELVETYGYYSARIYNVADKDEAWVVQVPRGHNWVAKRVPDDEVYYMPNWYSIREVDFNDKFHANYYWSENLVANAIAEGWYTPAKEGDYSDFDFAMAYQEGGDKKFDWRRADTAWPILLGHEPKQLRQFSEKPSRYIGLEECREVLKNHFDGKDYNITENGMKSPHVFAHFAPCNCMTLESSIVLFDDDPRLTTIYRANPKPCVAPYIPWFMGISEVPEGYNWLDEDTAQKTHFRCTEKDFRYDPDRPYWAYQTLLYLVEANYAENHAIVHDAARKLEDQWILEAEYVKEAYRRLKVMNEEAAVELLTSFTRAKCAEGKRWAQDMIRTLGERKIDRTADWDNDGE
ncbi:MAG: C69 family dipeptidase [Solobacterium sp.]|nr:C69 family dipeptidase [Solobacterium sp.]